MKTLLEDLHALLGLLEIDTRIEKARQTIAAMDTGADLAARFSAHKPEADALRAEANRTLALQRDVELKLGSVEEKARQVNATLYGGTVRGPRELENLQKELDMLGRQKDAAELEVLEAMEVAQKAAAAADAAELEQATLARRYRKVRVQWQERHDALTAEIQSLQAPRAAAAAQVERADLLARYDAIRPKKNGIGAAVLDADQSCTACHIKVNKTIADAVRLPVTPQLCEHCQRLLIPAPRVVA